MAKAKSYGHEGEALLRPDVGTGENRFGVSDEAIAWRRFNLGLVSERPA